MGKYDDMYDEDVILGIDQEIQLVIANELAEANRLTRLKVQLDLAKHGLPKEKYDNLVIPFQEDKA